VLKPENSPSSGCTHISPNKVIKLKHILFAYQKADVNCFLGNEKMSVDDGIHATSDYE
jgi:hypothetical protein